LHKLSYHSNKDIETIKEKQRKIRLEENPIQPKYYGSFVEMVKEEERIPDKEFLNNCYNWVLKLVNKVSSFLHESKDNLTLFGLNQAEEKSKENPRSHVE
jgi:hypothetical protein